jgi:hypothetical protein
MIMDIIFFFATIGFITSICFVGKYLIDRIRTPEQELSESQMELYRLQEREKELIQRNKRLTLTCELRYKAKKQKDEDDFK